MSDNLDDFLRQAAERRAKRQQQKQGGQASTSSSQQGSPPASPMPPAARTSPSPPAKPRQVFSSPNTPKSNAPAAKKPTQVRPAVGNLQPSLSGRRVESDLEYADERMEAHLQEAFSTELNTQSLKESQAAPKVQGARKQEEIITVGDLKNQLRNPQTLRLAILAQEILKRPYP